MSKKRIQETTTGIQDSYDVEMFNQMARRLRDNGWTELPSIIKSGIDHGLALEYGPGPGYIGLEWLKKTQGTTLKGVDISPAMVELARNNAAEYNFTDRVDYIASDGKTIPFPDKTFDAVFSTSSFHEWENPTASIDEIHRVLKPGGRLFIGDLRRDMFFLIKWFMWSVVKPQEIRPGLITSINSSYTVPEVKDVMKKTKFKDFTVKSNPMGLIITAVK